MQIANRRNWFCSFNPGAYQEKKEEIEFLHYLKLK